MNVAEACPVLLWLALYEQDDSILPHHEAMAIDASGLQADEAMQVFMRDMEIARIRARSLLALIKTSRFSYLTTRASEGIRIDERAVEVASVAPLEDGEDFNHDIFSSVLREQFS